VRLCLTLSFVIFIHSSLLPLSDLQYSCIMSNNWFSVLGLLRSRYSPQGPTLSPSITASITIVASTCGAMALALANLLIYSCSGSLSPFMRWRSPEVRSWGWYPYVDGSKPCSSSLQAYRWLWQPNPR
jgi:hypothetical protein